MYPFGVMFPQPTVSLDVNQVSVSAMMSRSLSNMMSTKSPPLLRMDLVLYRQKFTVSEGAHVVDDFGMIARLSLWVK